MSAKEICQNCDHKKSCTLQRPGYLNIYDTDKGKFCPTALKIVKFRKL